MTLTRHPLTVLTLPAYNSLTEQQVRGLACVWNSEHATPDVDLGERTFKRLGTPTSWHPRACRPCAMEQSMAALREHSDSCEQCIDDFTQCEKGRGLVRAVREARR
jgi:hypothetical protein